MTLRIAINGFGRIGRNVLRALYTQGYRQDLQVVAINDLGDSAMNAHLLKYDSVHGIFDATVEADHESLTVNGDRIAVSAIRNPAELPWKAEAIDVVFECTGLFTDRAKAAAHLAAGAGKVIVSAPAKGADATVVYGVNHDILRASHQVISNASCTTNCLAPIAQVLHREFGIEQGLMTTIHAYTNDQVLTDVYHSDPYRARSATQSMIPSKTGAAEAVGLVLPELAGKLTGMAVRVPVINVSLVDLTVNLKREATAEQVNQLFLEASKHSKVLGYNALPLVSCDFNHNPLSSIYDANHTRANGRMLKVLAWYDNEWGFSNRMLDNCLALCRAG
ncbi:type I glyceraldehyde-3-phosphate dehydrogenase [Pseudomonas sp. TYF_15]|jgi:glyceraldehyde 3-phosphate dehydrogenase|uniref:Glyceraldehyde-3-phosphate dehydrogenase n=2 Tax=Pseudomonas TaxID=286 RepID=A0A2S3WQW8_PSEPU|nr:type I glyceraldehyde-3-phosphate dehydrogenase [Pseudomonas putida]MCG3642368.1 type I glyceraldehyde-3-phosphate dehydrogenase [Pseudomonas putida]MDD2017296.1 type I glyceraldehyde-3-phosphate dehydrogenase [Pseudomonas putida]POF85361.1 type I glyceraldehyde-3-phosphate dehydrogenase [Pseudomonas putida]POG00710.1 type I glyceraldehyde-3-phosphate dehydrogenase [Pseudomonas putida]POG03818.1 type I glyceraldehyde-3-phosphate dehydrogenase [Pseudomonas putida]